ncbi:MAG: efflux RND transporter permease subunit [Gemmatimonadetes bacterium]|nr:efflux RND transporter permease subunit [Gemmatimonadota bacterium]MDA1104867.1 efflux RND transporter permease subunit [Gemmatimonadota bacterium]
MSIPSGSTRRPVAVWMLFLAIILLGVISYVRLPIDLLPDVSYPRLVIYTVYEEVAPAEVERRITQPIEGAAAAVPGVERVTSTSRYGVSLVTLRFAWGTDMDFAMLNVRERMDNVRESLPETVGRPTILRVDPESEPVMTLSVSGGEDLWQTKELSETVFRRRLEQLDGIAQAAVTGGLDREIRVEVEPRLLDSYGLTLEEISNALDQANVSAPGGTILQGRYRYPLRTLGEFQTVEEIADVVVARRSQGEGYRVIRLRDVGRVVDGFAEREEIARYGGQESVGILIFKESGANTVTVAETVGEVIAQLAIEYPSMRIDVADDQAGFIADSISNVVQALVFGGLLAFLVLFLFLRDPRYPVAIALAIPISVVGTFALMEAAGVSLNIMSLGGLALGVGMLVDNSIVVLENIFRHREELGEGAAQAAAAGAEEVQSAITASTLTTISVFGPIIYVEGVAGELFKDLSLAVAFSLLVSLLVALTLLPSLAARFAGGASGAGGNVRTGRGPRPLGLFAAARWLVALIVTAPFRLLRAMYRLLLDLLKFWGHGVGRLVGGAFAPLLRGFDVAFGRFASAYHDALSWALDRPVRVLASSLAAMVVTVALGFGLPRDLLPHVDQGAFTIRLELAEGTALEATDEAAVEIEDFVLADPDVDAVFATVGRNVRAYAEGEEASGLHTATFQVRVRPGGDTEATAERVRALTSRFPVGALSVETGQATALGSMLGGSEADVSVRVRGEDLDQVFTMAGVIAERVATVEAMANVRIGTERGQPQIQIEIDRAACASYGIDPQLVASTIDRAMRGNRATEFVDFDRKIDVMVRYPDERRYSRQTLDGIRVSGVPIRELVRIREAEGQAEVHREDQARVIPVYADVVSGGLDQAILEIEEALSTLTPTPEIRWDVGGENEEMRRSFRDLAFAFALALVLVYMILAAQFESFVHPFTILMSVPLALVGVVLALIASGQGLNTMSLIGVVILVGIVVNDAIVKVDFVNQSRRLGLGLREAILEAGRVRLRPIVMTTVTTMLGLAPMALGIGRGSDLRAPLAIAVIGGLLVATALTLIVVPVVYQSAERLRSGVAGDASP